MSYNDDATVIDTSEDGRFRVRVETDEWCDSPLESGDWWCVSVIYLSDRAGDYGRDMTALHDPDDKVWAWRNFAFHTSLDPDDAFVRYMSIMHGIKVHHVGVGSYGTSGLAWVEPSEAERVGGPGWTQEQLDNAVTSSLAEYNAWARGERYSYVVEELQTWARLIGDVPVFQNDDGTDGIREQWETVDSCSGLIGHEYAEQEAREAFAACVAQSEES